MESSGSIESKQTTQYYSLAIPEEDSSITHDQSLIATSLQDLQPLLKRNTHARFLNFKSYEDAVNFMQSPVSPDRGSPFKPKSIAKERASLPNSPHCPEKRSLGEERANNFPTPTPQEIAMINSYITRKLDIQLVEAIKLNPRLLCTDCDVAPAVHEGTKQNALHAAAKNNNVEAAKIILGAISDISLFESLYPRDDNVIRRERCRHLNMSYLNTPDKMMLETPLHFAAKFCSVDVLRLLVTHPLCNLEPKNDQGLTPVKMAGSRFTGENSAEKRSEVIRLLESVYIIPIWKDTISGTSRVGSYGKWISFGNKLPKQFLGLFSKFPDQLLPPFDETLLPVSGSAETSEISSYAGPMTKENAIKFQRLLKESSGRRIAENFVSPGPSSPISKVYSPPVMSPRRDSSLCSSPLSGSNLLYLPTTPTKAISSQSMADMTLRMKDGVKGLERLCGKYAKSLSVPWSEYWGFLDTFCDLESRNGLELFENFLLSKEIHDSVELCGENIFNKNFNMDSSYGGTELPWSNKSVKTDSSKVPVINQDPLVTSTLGASDSFEENINILAERLGSIRIVSPSSNDNSQNYSITDVLSDLENESFNCGDRSIITDFVNGHGHNSQYVSKSSDRTCQQQRNIEVDVNECWGYRNIANMSSNTSGCDSDVEYSENELSKFDINRLATEDDDRHSFITAISHWEAEEEEFEDCDGGGYSVFIGGNQPRESDKHAFNAIKNVIDDEILFQYPAISRWYNSMKASGFNKVENGFRATFSG